MLIIYDTVCVHFSVLDSDLYACYFGHALGCETAYRLDFIFVANVNINISCLLFRNNFKMTLQYLKLVVTFTVLKG